MESPRKVSLEDLPTRKLPLGSIEPRGWYRDILRRQADNFTGGLGEHWAPASRFSAWRGGTGDDGDEGPRYLDGLLPLAHLLHDESLIAEAAEWVDRALDFQRADGDFGPEANPDPWPRMVMLKALMQHAEATNDPRVIPFMERYATLLETRIEKSPLASFARVRGGELLLWLFWLYQRRPDEKWLRLADRIYAQALDWYGYLGGLPFSSRSSPTDPADAERLPLTRLVDIAMGLKTATLYSARSRDLAQRDSIRRGIDGLMRHHGVITRVPTGDTHLNGRSPSRGTELCAVVEQMFSLECTLGYFSDTWAADTLEMIAFNALPAGTSPDFRGHQRLQQANQVLVTRTSRAWLDAGEDANLFGLSHGSGCCTADLHQGWPKLASSLWRATSNGGLAAFVYAPGLVETKLNGGTRVRIETVTDYPFSESLLFRIDPEKPSRFPLSFRVPAWCDDALIAAPHGVESDIPAGSWTIIDRLWSAGDTVELTLPMRIRHSFWHRSSLGVELGPLVMALKIRERWSCDGGDTRHPDWSIHPMSPWNYALAADPRDPARGFTVTRAPITGPLEFSQGMAPVTVTARARRVAGWELEEGSAGEPPPSPIGPAQLDGDEEDVELIPYAFARLRVSEFPWYEASG